MILFAAAAAILSGCGVKGISGGTKGSISTGGVPLSEMQITAYKVVENESYEAIGFGITDSDGVFELVTNGAQGPLVLSTGEYRFTLESVGAPVLIPPDYLAANTTPLEISWPSENALNFEIPGIRPQ